MELSAESLTLDTQYSILNTRGSLPFFSSAALHLQMAHLIRAGSSGRLAKSGVLGAARSMSTAWWRHVEPAAKDPILGVTEAFLADPSPDKVNVGVVSIPALALDFFYFLNFMAPQ